MPAVVTLAHGPFGSIDGSTYAEAIVLVLVATAYLVGTRRLARRVVPPMRVASFIGGLVALGVAVSPAADDAAARTLSAHMAQHLVLWLLAPGLLVAGRPLTVLVLALPRGLRRFAQRLGMPLRPMARPLVVWGVSAVVLWGWHMPRLYQSAVQDGAVHALEHASFLGAAILFWGAVVGAMPYRRPGRGAAMLLVFATMVQSAWLAMVMSFADDVLYPLYALRSGSATALADQQLAGVLMWVPMAVVHAGVIGVLFLRWFGELDARSSRLDRASSSIPVAAVER